MKIKIIIPGIYIVQQEESRTTQLKVLQRIQKNITSSIYAALFEAKQKVFNCKHVILSQPNAYYTPGRRQMKKIIQDSKSQKSSNPRNYLGVSSGATDLCKIKQHSSVISEPLHTCHFIIIYEGDALLCQCLSPWCGYGRTEGDMFAIQTSSRDCIFWKPIS